MHSHLLGRINKNIFRSFSSMEPLSDLSFIEVSDPTNASTLFKEWIREAKLCGVVPLLMNLATATRNGRVKNRNVVIREIMPDSSLSFTSQAYSSKIQDINENPQVAATIWLNYKKDEKNISRQIGIVGNAEKLDQEKCKIYFEKHTLPSKIRSWIGRDCGPVHWNHLKLQHDELLKQVVENGKVLIMPDSVVAFKIVPHEIDFYYNVGDKIGDRIIFKKDAVSSVWKYVRVMP